MLVCDIFQGGPYPFICDVRSVSSLVGGLMSKTFNYILVHLSVA